MRKKYSGLKFYVWGAAALLVVIYAVRALFFVAPAAPSYASAAARRVGSDAGAERLRILAAG